MQINQPDALKNWLTSVLEPLCDADPSALARYVLALLKKDKAIKDLAQCMTDQLDVFLGAETTNFLNQLFQAIQSEEYLNAVTSVTSIKQDNAIETKTINSQNDEQTTNKLLDARECTPPIVDVKMKEINSIHVVNNNNNINNVNSIEEISPILQLEKTPNDAISSISSQDFSPVIQPAVIMERDKQHNRRRTSLQSKSRSRSRSRSYEKQQNRSRSRDRRMADREKSSRQYRNQSPPHQFGSGNGGGGGIGINNDRRKFERRINDRSPPIQNSYGRQRMDRSKSRSISPLMSRQRKNSLSPLNSADLSAKLKRQRCRDFDEKGYCMRGETCPWDHGTDPVVLEDIQNPSMLIQNAPHMRGGGSAGGVGGGEYNPDAPELWNRGNNFGPRGPMHRNGPPPPPPPPPPNAYQRLGIGFRGMPPYPFPMNPAVTPLQRELISIPVADGSSGGDISAVQIKRRYEPEDTVAIAEGPTKRKPINSRLGPRIGLQQNCSLELRKVPRGLNSIAHLNNHFSKFGKIINIQISYDGDPEAAIVTFSTHAEANVAYRSTEAVLNNRFIKVFWHTPGGGNGQNNNNNGGGGGAGGSTNDTQTSSSKDEIISHVKKGNQYSLNNITNNATTLLNNNTNNINNMIPAVPTAAASTDVPKPVPPVSATLTPTSSSSSASSSTTTPIHSSGATLNSTLTVSNPTISTALTTTTAASVITTNAISAAAAALRTKIRVNRAATEIIRKKQEDRVKGTVQLVNMNKKKHEILQEYLKQMRTCVDYLERADANDPKRGQYVETINDLQLLIDKLNKDIAAEQAQITANIPAQPPPVRTKEQAKKEILDLELELIAQQQEGNDTTTIEKRLEELQKSLPSTISTKSNFGGTRSIRPRPPPPGSTSVDRRPSSLVITGFSTEESDAILGHFKHFGEVTNSQFDKSIPFLLITYATRTIAEQAALRGQFFKDKTLKIKWALPNSPTVKKAILENVNGSSSGGGGGGGGVNSGGGLVGVDNTNITGDSEEIRMEEEEEEEDTESESRSWRR